MILSRSFCNTSVVTNLNEIEEIFRTGMAEIRSLEKECDYYARYFWDNRAAVEQGVAQICASIEEKNR